MSWRRVAVLVANLPREAASTRTIHGEAIEWTLGNHLLAGVLDEVRNGNWQRASAGGSKAKRPTPTPRPGVTPGLARKFGTARKTVAQMRKWLDDRKEVGDGS